MSQNTTTLPYAPADFERKSFDPSFWVLNSIEMFERLAFYTLRVMAPIYIMQADDPGGLHLSAQMKGVIYLLWSIFQSILPMATGGFADRYGYKNTLIFSISMMMTGYLMIAFLRDIPGCDNFWLLMISILTLATGTAFFKPSIQGSLAANLTKANSSLGWGIFYWVVNVGAFVGHYIPAAVFAFMGGEHTPQAWRNLFLLSAVFTSFNFALLFMYKDVPTGADKTRSPLEVLAMTFVNIFEPRLIAWLVIMSGFWMMMYQLWDLQPNFISDWVDSSAIANSLTWLPAWMHAGLTEVNPTRGLQIPQQVWLSVNSLMIIIGVVGVAWLTRRMRTLTAMCGGMIMATVGVLVAGLTMNPWMLVLGIVFFSLGEMSTGPKKSEYLALIAPPGKRGLYLGYVNIPAGIGSGFGATIAGYVYGHFGEKATLALRYLAEKTQTAGKPWDGDIAGLEKFLDIKRTDGFAKLMEVTGLDAAQATQLLWETYDPHLWVWIPFACIGIVSAIALAIFGQMAKRWSDMNA